MKFVDEVTLDIQAGKGGAGSVHFRREKFIPFGGPDGGNGGAGGSVILVADPNTQTLLDFHFRPLWKAEDGEAGSGSNKEGKSGEDLIIKVPIGTEIIRSSDSTLVADLTVAGQSFILAKGGRGGKGNDFFKSATNQTPRYAQPGEEGEKGQYTFSLKLLADVGLVGFPNAGKSTLISRISQARPKIADYPFTTLVPNLGVARSKSGDSFVIADIPGLIPGASQGKGLGIQFLKHVERTRLIVHLIDPHQLNDDGSPLNALDAYNMLHQELKAFSQELAARRELVVLTKADTFSSPSELDTIKEKLTNQGLECMVISSISSFGLMELVERISAVIKESKDLNLA